MNLFLHLVRKELRDVRWHVRGGLVAVAGLVLLTYWFADRTMRSGPGFDANGSVALLWSVLAGLLGGGAVAAEVFGGETTSRRIEGTALLPVGLGRVFAAKSAVTLGVTVMFAAWATAWAPLAAGLFASGDTAQGAMDAFEQAPLAGLASVPAVAAVVLVAIVLEHGLGAIVAGTAVAGATFVGVMKFAPWDDWGIVGGATEGVVVGAALTIVLWSCAALAFVHGPIHLGRRIRRAALGIGVAIPVLGGAGGAAASVLDARTELRPGDDVYVGAVCASPDGRRAVVIVGAHEVPTICRAWLVDLESGATTVLPGRHRSFESWRPDGTVRLYGSRRSGSVETVDEFDATTGAHRRTLSLEQAESEPRDEHWARVRKTAGGFLVEWPERGVKRLVEPAQRVLVAEKPGRFLAWISGQGEHVIDLDAGTERKLEARVQMGSEQWLDGGRSLRYGTNRAVRVHDAETGDDREVAASVIPAGARVHGWFAVVVPTARTTSVVDLRDLRTVAGPWPSFGKGSRVVWFLPGSDRRAMLYGADPTTILDCETGREVAIHPDPNSYGYPPNAVAVLPGDRLLVARRGPALDVIDADGRLIRSVTLR